MNLCLRTFSTVYFWCLFNVAVCQDDAVCGYVLVLDA
jgi:hypothetical protein